MAVHNGEDHLRESIESILNQTFSDFEFIIIDDCSSDNTFRILREYAEKDSRLKIIKNEKNLGLTKSLNKGIRYSSGEYIARMDAGDTSERDRLEKQVKFLDGNNDYGLVGTWSNVIDQDSKKIGEMKYETGSDALKKYLIKHNPIIHSSIMVRKSVLGKIGLYDEKWKYAQDYELYFRIAKDAKIANLPEFLVSNRMSPNSITSRKNKEQVMFAIKARLKAIREHQYGLFSYVYVIKPFVGYLLPYKLKMKIKNL